MITLYGMASPNVVKIYIALEELALPYTVHPVDVFTGKQFDDAFLKLNPNAKVPVIVDPDGPGGKPYTVFESGAILLYLAEKTGKLLPKDTREKFDAIQWLMTQMSTVGPMFGQFVHFLRFAPPGNDYSKSRYLTQASRVCAVIDQRLARRRIWPGPNTRWPTSPPSRGCATSRRFIGRRGRGEIPEHHALGEGDRRAAGGEEGAGRGGSGSRPHHGVRQGGSRDAGPGLRARPVRRRLTTPAQRSWPWYHTWFWLAGPALDENSGHRSLSSGNARPWAKGRCARGHESPPYCSTTPRARQCVFPVPRCRFVTHLRQGGPTAPSPDRPTPSGFRSARKHCKCLG